jgi:alkylation response protein AidB-like acyl-CoA dehydrogenase
MDLSLSDEQEQLRSSFRSLFDRECDVECVRSAEPLGFAPELWKRVVELGAADMAVPEVAGGAGATLLDAAVICETVGEFVAPVPVVETMVANRLLARLGSGLASVTLLDAIDRGSVTTVALSRPVDGEVRWVPAGAVAEAVIVADGERVLVLTDRAPDHALANLASLPLAHRSAHGALVLATGVDAAAAFRTAVDEWRVLTAAVLWGAGRRALDIAIAYAKERKAFGVPIATYQSVAHRMADLATALEGSRLLNRKAAWAGRPA